jgi:hypothetical protein
MFGIDMSVLIFGATIAGAFTLLGYFTSKFRKSGDSSSSSVYKVIGFVSNLFVFTSTVGLVFVFPMVWYGLSKIIGFYVYGNAVYIYGFVLSVFLLTFILGPIFILFQGLGELRKLNSSIQVSERKINESDG